MTPSVTPTEDPARYLPVLRGLFGELPATHSPMQAEGKKYNQRRGAPTLEQFRAHLRGQLTLATPLIGVDGRARALAIDVDEGGEPPIWALIDAAAAQGLWAYGFALDTGPHNGGHVWCPFDESADPRRLRHLAGLLIEAAGLPEDTERWPSGPRSDMRLPFGRHVRADSRGTLLLRGRNGERLRFLLDNNAGLRAGLAAIAIHTQNPIALLPQAPPEPERSVRATANLKGATGGIRGLAVAAGLDDLLQLLDEFGAAEFRRRNGPEGEEVLLHCPCGGHSRGEQNGALVVKMGRNGIVQVHSYSTGCAFYTGPGKYHDYPDVHRIVRGTLPNLPRRAVTNDERRHTDPAQAEARKRDAARKRQSHAAEAAATMQDVRDRAAADPILARRPAERAVLHAMIQVAGDRDWCRPSKTRLVEMTSMSLGAVKRALMELESRCYFRSEGDGGGPNNTALRTFLRGSPSPCASTSAPDVSTGIRLIHESVEHVISEHMPVAGEGGRGGDPDRLDDAEWAVLLTSAPATPDELADPAAVAAWELEAGLCEVPEALLPAVASPTATEPVALPSEQATSAVEDDPAGAIPQRFPGGRRRLRDYAGLQWHLEQVDKLWQDYAQRGAYPPRPAADLDDLALVVLEAELAAAERAEKATARAYGRAKAIGSKEACRHAYWAYHDARKRTRELRAHFLELSAARRQQGNGAAPPSPAPSFAQTDIFGYMATASDPPVSHLAVCADRVTASNSQTYHLPSFTGS